MENMEEQEKCPRKENAYEMHFFFNLITHRYQRFNDREDPGVKGIHFLFRRTELTLLSLIYFISFTFFIPVIPLHSQFYLQEQFFIEIITIICNILSFFKSWHMVLPTHN